MSLFLVARLVSEYSKNSTQRYVYVEIFRISKKWINLRFVMCIFPNKFKIYLIDFINEICRLSNKQDRYCVLACFLNALLLFEITLLFGLEQRKRVVAEISILRHKSVEIRALQQRFYSVVALVVKQ